MRPQKTIALLFHEQDTPASIRRYLITHYATLWQEQGSHIVVLFGIRRFVPADLIVVHVDLSVVPDEYLEFAACYPIVVNGAVKDIRKSTVSQHLVTQNSNYIGPVIIKSDLNYAGMPERHYGVMTPAASSFKTPFEYSIFNSYAEIPPALLARSDVIVERFLPEFEDGLYHIRFYNFLGRRGNCMRIASRSPVVHMANAVKIEQIPCDPRLEQLRQTLKFDYGKFDYVVRDGEVVVFDTNKTTGFVGQTDDAAWQDARLFRAMGIYDYF